MCSLCNLKKRNKITKKCLRGWKSSNIWEIALLSLVLPGRKDKKNARLFFLSCRWTFFCICWLPFLRSVQWLNAGNHRSQKRRGTHTHHTKKKRQSFRGGSRRKKEREAVRHKLHRLRKVYNPRPYTFSCWKYYCKLACFCEGWAEKMQYLGRGHLPLKS